MRGLFMPQSFWPCTQDGGNSQYSDSSHSAIQVGSQISELDFRWKESGFHLRELLMETYRLLEELKGSIGRDFRDLEERCNEAENKIQCLEKENSAARELTSQLRNENASLKGHLAKLQKELAYKEEKQKRKIEELRRMDSWWNCYRRASERRFRAMKEHGNFPPRILEKFVHRDIEEQMKDTPEDYISLRDNKSIKTSRNLSTLKCKKKVRYDKVSNETSSLEEKKEKYFNNDEVNRKMNNFEENVLSDPNESTKLYQNECPEQGHDVRELGSNGLRLHQRILVPETEDVSCSLQQENDNLPVVDKVSVHQEVVVPDTEDPYAEEVFDGLHHSIGAPSAASTPLAAVNSPLFGYDNDNNNEVSAGILDGVGDKSPCNDTVNLLTAATTPLVHHLPKSDSQFPVDLSYTQPQSPTIPSRTQSLQQDLNLTADCSVSLLPHGMRNEQVESAKTDFILKQNAAKERDDTASISTKTNNQAELKRNGNFIANTEESKQRTGDGNLLRNKASTGDKSNGGGKRKRKSSGEADYTMWPNESKQEEPSDMVFKVPVAPPPKTPEVVLLEEFPSHVTRKKSCSTPLSSSGDITEHGTMDQSADLFGNIDDCFSPDLHGEKIGKDVSLENSQKENMSANKNCAVKPDFKCVEVVRKRDERAKLNGYKCRECQEYYQGLNLPEEELKKRLKKCSRHRARFSPPPCTPPGFWNLSFPDTQEYMEKGYLKTEFEVPAPKRLRTTRRNRITK